MYKVLVIVNPKAGKAESDKYIPEIIEKLKETGNEFEIKYTTIENNATEIIKTYEQDYDVLLVYGGDGTLNEVVQGLYEVDKKAYVGFIPLGTTNDFAKSLMICKDNVDIQENKKDFNSKKVDTGLLSDNVFNYVVCFGMFSKTSYNTSRELKNKIGKTAYWLSRNKRSF